jgi:hypothetical protein
VPRDIEGLDTELGLKRVLGKVPRYQSMLEKYVAGQAGAVAALRAALALEDRETATRLAHTTRGVSGNIGATSVQQLAEGLELAIKTGQSPAEVAPLLDALQQSLDPLVQAIAQRLPQVQVVTPAAAVAVDETELLRVTQRLRELLTDMDSEASDWLERHRAILSSAYPAHLPSVDSALQAFEFDTAAEQLDAGLAAHVLA